MAPSHRAPGAFASLAVTVLLIAFGKTTGLASILQEFFITVLYSVLIGGILAAVMPAIWSRSERWKQTPRWAARLGAIALGTAVGALLSGAMPVLRISRALCDSGHRFGDPTAFRSFWLPQPLP